MVASKQWVVILHRIVLTLPDEVCTPPYSFVSNIPDIFMPQIALVWVSLPPSLIVSS